MLFRDLEIIDLCPRFPDLFGLLLPGQKKMELDPEPSRQTLPLRPFLPTLAPLPLPLWEAQLYTVSEDSASSTRAWIECLLFTGMNLNADSQTRLSSPTLFLSISVIHWPYSTRPVHSLLSSRLPHFISLWWGGVFLGLDECKEHLRPIFSHLRFFVKRIVCALIHAQSLMIL